MSTVIEAPIIPVAAPLRGCERRLADSRDSLEGDLPLFHPDSAEMEAVVISDLHLGSDNCQAKAAAGFLQSLLDGEIITRRLIINGDVFDSIDFRRLKKTHWKVLSQIRHLSDKIGVIWIVGNHDGSAEVVSHLLGVQVLDEFVLHSGGETILIIHGHQFDDFINDHPVLTWAADCAYWLMQKIDRTHFIARLAKRRSKIFVRCTSKIRDRARRLAHSRQCTAVLCGHTHHAESVAPTPEYPAAYHNSGCWTESPCTYLTIRGGEVKAHAHGVKARATSFS
ncbi:MAG TPA: UDP-2,3-diacylglucosamine diphosphatase [Phycisphaerae bacterium]|nr:UDP-2,3-diacylglucosamine diphosphatase [Phycisphaerae bacterium]